MLFMLLAGLNVAGFVAVFDDRETLTDEQWQFLDKQGLKFTDSGAEINIVKDGLSFAVARRPIGGWEPLLVRALLLVNLPAYIGSFAFFQALQALPGGGARLHSDLATVVFAGAVLGQWALVASWLRRPRKSARSGRRSELPVDPPN
jgi:hypothetical protein